LQDTLVKPLIESTGHIYDSTVFFKLLLIEIQIK